jgi:hypothetical protein
VIDRTRTLGEGLSVARGKSYVKRTLWPVRDYPLGPREEVGGVCEAWIVDAADNRVAEDFDEGLLHRTPEIDGFLSLERDDKFIVIGTKGFGKKLLLKPSASSTSAKRRRSA